MRFLALFVVVLSACGRFGFDDKMRDGASTDTAIDSASDSDIALGAWSPPLSLTELNLAAEPDDDPTLTGDQLEVFWDSGRPPGVSGDIFTARRTSVMQAFGVASIVTELRSGTDDTTPDVSADGLAIYFASDRAAAGDRDLYRSTRPDRSSPWSTPARVLELASPQDDGSGIETADGLALYFSSERSGMGDVYVATRAGRGQPWGAAVPVAGVSEPTRREDQFWIDPTGTLIYFTNRSATTSTDIWRASRRAPDQPFGTAAPVSELDTISGDSDPWLSPDLRTLVFASDRDGMFDLYITTR